MPSINSVALYSLAALGAAAAPWERRHNGRCLSDAQADQVATSWASLITDYNADVADAVTTENLTDYSESVNTLINSCPQGPSAKPLPLLAPTFSTREQFKQGQGEQPPINFERLNLWHSCDTVIIRWKTTNTAPIPEPKPVVGLISLEVVKNPNGGEYPWLIDTVYSEFDSGAWLQNLVEAGICSSGAGLPGNSTCSSASASSTVVSPASSSSSWVESSTWAPSTTSTWVESSATWAPSSSTWTPSSSWAAETTSCSEEDETSATATAYASTTTWA